jgi:hypothetical protein
MRATVAFWFIFVTLNSSFSKMNSRTQRTKRTLIFFWRQVMQPVLLRVYFGLLRCVVSAPLERDVWRSRALLVVEDGGDE